MSTITSPPPAAVAGTARGEQLRHWLPLAVVLTGTFMSVLDFFIVNVALPSVQRSLHASASDLEWTSAGYALATAVLLVASGRLGDRFGRRAMFAAGLSRLHDRLGGLRAWRRLPPRWWLAGWSRESAPPCWPPTSCR